MIIGEMIDHYIVREKIGEGGMGIVYRAEDTRLGRQVALKILPAEWNGDADLRRRLAREARAASTLTHPCVAAVYDYHEHVKGSFIVFEYVEGTTLCVWAASHRCTLPELLSLATQLADTLDAARKSWTSA